MQLVLGSVSLRKYACKNVRASAMVREYVERIERYSPIESVVVESESALLALAARTSARAAARIILFEATGEALTSESFAAKLEHLRDTGTQRIVFGIGPPDGWSPNTLKNVHARLSFGSITLPHELARIIAAEQIYRALTILAGHPYHNGH